MAGRAVYTFEQTEDLALLPLAARRALDLAGQKLSLAGWRSLPREAREALVEAGAFDQPPLGRVRAVLAQAEPAATPVAVRPDPSPEEAPAELAELLGGERSLSPDRWCRLRALDRYALRHLATRERREQLLALYGELEKPRATHLDEQGEARMVGVGAKPQTTRRAVASARVSMSPATLAAIADLPKGDALGTARIAGIQAAKRTHELIPLCHALSLSRVDVRFETDPAAGVVMIFVTAEAVDRTGVEMEALTGASVAALTLYDMVKGIERGVTIGPVQLELKEGGRTGTWKRGEP